MNILTEMVERHVENLPVSRPHENKYWEAYHERRDERLPAPYFNASTASYPRMLVPNS